MHLPTFSTIMNVLFSLSILIIISVVTNGGPASPWSGRTCSDMKCLRNEVCVMEQGLCDYRGQCGSYPTCRIQKRESTSCENYRCPPGQYCTLIEDRCTWKPCPSHPACISTNSTGNRYTTRRPW